jgi:hypothetical protein
MRRRLGAVLFAMVAVGSSVVALGGPAGASGLSLRVSPSTHLVNNQKVTITASGLGKSRNGSIVTWFASECIPKAAHVRNLDPGYSPYCSSPLIKALRVTPAGTVKVSFKVGTGTVGAGSCGVPSHLTCLIAVGTAVGKHKTATISFKNVFPKPKATTTSTAAKTTTSSTT